MMPKFCSFSNSLSMLDEGTFNVPQRKICKLKSNLSWLSNAMLGSLSWFPISELEKMGQYIMWVIFLLSYSFLKWWCKVINYKGSPLLSVPYCCHNRVFCCYVLMLKALGLVHLHFYIFSLVSSMMDALRYFCSQFLSLWLVRNLNFPFLCVTSSFI